MNEEQLFESWAILELLGHVRVAGLITEEEHFGGKLGRVDIPSEDGFLTQYFGHGSIYRITPCTEEVARAVSKHYQPRPLYPFELPAAIEPSDSAGEWREDEF